MQYSRSLRTLVIAKAILSNSSYPLSLKVPIVQVRSQQSFVSKRSAFMASGPNPKL